MLLEIAKRDLVELFRDGRLLWTGGLLLILLLTGLTVGWQRQAESQAERATASKLDYDDWLKQPLRHPHDAAHQGMHVFKPEPALAIIDPGLTPYVGSTLWLQAHRQSEVKFRPAQDATGLQRFGTLSVSWVMQILAPLLVIVLGFNALAGERERGTLRQVLSLGIAPRQLLRGKALALAASVAMLLIPAAVVALIVVLVSAESGARVDAALRLGWLGLGYAVYLGIFIFLVLAVSARARSSRIALIVLLGVWIGVSVLAPRLIADLSRTWYPSEGRSEFNAALDSEIDTESQQVWTRTFGEDSGKVFGTDVPMSKWGLALEVYDKAGYGVMDRHFNALWESYAQQQTAQEWAGVFIPTVAVRAFSMGIAGTDFAQHRAFSVAAERQRRLIQDIVSHDLKEHADGHGETHFAYRAGSELWAEVPPFKFAAPAAFDVIRQNMRSLAVLLCGLMLAFVLAHVATPRRWLA